MINRRQAALLALASALLAGCGRNAGADNSIDSGAIRFAVFSLEPKAILSDEWAPIVADMQAVTGLKVKLSFIGGDAALIEAMRRRRIDLGWLSNQSALAAVRRTDGEVFARPIPLASGGGDYAILVANARNKLTLERVLKCDRRLTLGLGEALSTPASLAPETYLFAPRGTWPEKCFREVRRGSPEANLDLVADGKLDVAALSSTWLRRARLEGHRQADAVQEIWRSPPLAENPLLWRRDLDPAIKEKLRQFFLTYGDGDTPQAAVQRARLARIGLAGFAPADASHLLPAREMEATHAWLEAEQSGDKARIEVAKQALDAVRAERLDLEARTRAPAAAQ
ncbi:MAG: phosphate/phosphite/phosphonate ABC transporter substrate-binding protein [Caulobacteraceae bacterium]